MLRKRFLVVVLGLVVVALAACGPQDLSGTWNITRDGTPVAEIEVRQVAPTTATPTATPVATEEPPVATEEPPAATEEPPAATEEPTAATEEPPAATEEPTAATEEPPAATEEPPAATEEPPAATEEPTVSPTATASFYILPVKEKTVDLAAVPGPVMETASTLSNVDVSFYGPPIQVGGVYYYVIKTWNPIATDGACRYADHWVFLLNAEGELVSPTSAAEIYKEAKPADWYRFDCQP